MKIVKIAAKVVAGLIVLVGLVIATAVWQADRKAERVIAVDVAPVAYVDDAAARAHGKYLFESRGCSECHGADGGGKVVIDTGGMLVRSPDISPTKSGVVAAYTERDWVRAIRHGVKADGRPIRVMPSEDYARMSDPDLAALVAYARSLPPAAGAPAELRFPVLVKVLYAFGAIPDAADKIDHALPPAKPVPVAVTAAHGEYVAGMCKGCHGPRLKGGKIPGAPPDWPAAADLTPGGPVMARYDSAGTFAAMMRTGRRPDGTAVSRVMPFESLKALDDTDLAALQLYLAQRPADRS